MSEARSNPHNPDLKLHHEKLDDDFKHGFELAESKGFDLKSSLIAEGIGSNQEFAPAERAEQILDTAIYIAKELDLEPGFYERPAHTILLASIASAWVENERKADASPDHDPKLAAERDMLVDASMVLAGKYSKVAKEIGRTNSELQDRYVEEVSTANELERVKFYESINDSELALLVEDILKKTGPGSLLDEQRSSLGVTSASEQPFRVKVLKVGSRWDLIDAGVIEPVVWPTSEDTTPEGRTRYLELNKLALAHDDRNSEIVAPYEQAAEDYADKFESTQGPLPPAFVNFAADGSVTMYLRSAEAHTLVNQFEHKAPVEDEKEFERKLAYIRHEYSHTQKQMFIGAHSQMGLILEERKAELLSGDHHGYPDIKNFITDLSMSSDTDLVQVLADSVKEPDSLTEFLINASEKIGLHNALMVMLAKPLPYEKDLEYAQRFTDISSITDKVDISTLDAVVRRDLEKRGDSLMRMRAAKWAEKQQLDPKQIAFFRDFYLGYRKRNGSGHGTKYIAEAVEKRIQEVEQARTAID